MIPPPPPGAPQTYFVLLVRHKVEPLRLIQVKLARPPLRGRRARALLRNFWGNGTDRSERRPFPSGDLLSSAPMVSPWQPCPLDASVGPKWLTRTGYCSVSRTVRAYMLKLNGSEIIGSCTPPFKSAECVPNGVFSVRFDNSLDHVPESKYVFLGNIRADV